MLKRKMMTKKELSERGITGNKGDKFILFYGDHDDVAYAFEYFDGHTGTYGQAHNPNVGRIDADSFWVKFNPDDDDIELDTYDDVRDIQRDMREEIKEIEQQEREYERLAREEEREYMRGCKRKGKREVIANDNSSGSYMGWVIVGLTMLGMYLFSLV
ncbi:hypothetical protein YJ57_20300 [Salmonella enterica subsp. enterica]|nr:hypothetical protein [Salmonella enterica subsp. enterica]EDV1533703.1 hypothetical protein [Salmonella enterica subsp. enterica]